MMCFVCIVSVDSSLNLCVVSLSDWLLIYMWCLVRFRCKWLMCRFGLLLLVICCSCVCMWVLNLFSVNGLIR